MKESNPGHTNTSHYVDMKIIQTKLAVYFYIQINVLGFNSVNYTTSWPIPTLANRDQLNAIFLS